MMTEANSGEYPDEQEPRAARGPGSRLRSARERKGLDISLVADQLHLTERHVIALENDAYDELPGLVFVQGYLRNYARLVDEPVNEILADFGQVKPANEYSPALRKFSFHSPLKPSRHSGSGRGIAKTLFWLIVLVLIALFVIWKRGYIQLPAGLLGQQGGGELLLESPATPEAASSIGSSSNQLLLSSVTSEASPPSPTPENPSVAQEPDVVESADAMPVELPVATQTTAGEEEAREGSVAVDEPQSTPEPAAPVIASMAASSTGIDGAAVVLEFTAPCWVDIRDAGGEKVLYGGIGGGETHTLGGTPPYRLVLGNSSVVKISVGGKPFDTGAFSSGKVARFSIDPKDATLASSGALD